jgi:hypothetical protein
MSVAPKRKLVVVHDPLPADMPAPTMMTLGPLAPAREAFCAANSTTASRATMTEEGLIVLTISINQL